MEIQELILKHYGRFENHKIRLKPGINIIYGGNEAGKSTIHSFIRCMLFGIERARGKAAKTDEYQIRQPWETPGAFDGSMRVEKSEMIYRIDRCFDRSIQPLQIMNETTGEIYQDPQSILGFLTGDISESTFMNTVCIPQAQVETDEAMALELRRFIINSENTMDSKLDVEKALQILRKKKKQFEQQKKKEESVMEQQIEKKQNQAENIRKELELLSQQAVLVNPALKERLLNRHGNGQSEKRIDEYRAEHREKHREEYREEYREELRGNPGEEPTESAEAGFTGKVGAVKLLLEILIFLAAIGTLFGAWYLKEVKLKLFLGSFGAAFLLLVILVHFLVRDEEYVEIKEAEKSQKPETITEVPIQNNLIGFQEQRVLLETIERREAEYRKLQDELEELYSSHVRLDGCDTEIAALNISIDRICSLSSNIYAASGGQLNERASEILSELTNGAYSRIRLDEASEVRIYTPSRVLGLHQVSGGTMHQIYFALRMAAGELLCEEELPLLLDETFALYDDARLESALRWLKKSKRQVILFSCQKREREILRRIEA